MSDRITVGDVEDRKPKRQFQEKTEDFLTLSLCSNYHNGDKSSASGSATKAESQVGESRFSAKNGEPSRRRRKQEFICKFCQKNFKSGQALGGHLNAHRGQRDLIRKMDQEIDLDPDPSRLGHLELTLAPVSSNSPVLANLPPPISRPGHGHGHGSYGTSASAPNVNDAAENNQMQQTGSAAGEREEQNLDLSLSL